MPRISLEEKTAFVQRIADQIGAWEEPYTDEKINQFAEYLHTHPNDYNTFMRYSRKQGKTNRFFSRIPRMMALL